MSLFAPELVIRLNCYTIVARIAMKKDKLKMNSVGHKYLRYLKGQNILQKIRLSGPPEIREPFIILTFQPLYGKNRK